MPSVAPNIGWQTCAHYKCRMQDSSLMVERPCRYTNTGPYCMQGSDMPSVAPSIGWQTYQYEL